MRLAGTTGSSGKWLIQRSVPEPSLRDVTYGRVLVPGCRARPIPHHQQSWPSAAAATEPLD